MVTEKIRIYDLARDLKAPNKDIIDVLKDQLNIQVKSHSSTINMDVANKVKQLLKEKQASNKTQKSKEEANIKTPTQKRETPKETENTQEPTTPQQTASSLSKKTQENKEETPATSVSEVKDKSVAKTEETKATEQDIKTKEIMKETQIIADKLEQETVKKTEETATKSEEAVEKTKKETEKAKEITTKSKETEKPAEETANKTKPKATPESAQRVQKRPYFATNTAGTKQTLKGAHPYISGNKYKHRPDNKTVSGQKPNRYGRKPTNYSKQQKEEKVTLATQQVTITQDDLKLKVTDQSKTQELVEKDVQVKEKTQVNITTEPKQEKIEETKKEGEVKEPSKEVTTKVQPERTQRPNPSGRGVPQKTFEGRPPFPRPMGQRPPKPGFVKRFGDDTKRFPPRPNENRGTSQGPGQQDRRPQPGPGNRPPRPQQPAAISTGAVAADKKPFNKGKKAKSKEFIQKEKFEEAKNLKEIFKKKKAEKQEALQVEKPTEVCLNKAYTIAELSDILLISGIEIISQLIQDGIFATMNETISLEIAKDVTTKLGYTLIEEETEEKENEKESDKAIKEMVQQAEKEKGDLVNRAPIVTIMGHVDHGKTTLLDSIRKAKHNIVDSEAGGITQSIGAYTVNVDDKKVVFIDTPGHEAFTAMRSRGSKITDIAIIIVAADDGIMPQTIESINHVKAANVPIIVAVNKVDKEGADPDKVLQQLTNYGLVPEKWGGETITEEISAIKGTNIDKLLEWIVIVSELHELTADPEMPASGVVIESELDKGKGSLARVIVQNGTLKIGDNIIIGSLGGKVRALINDYGERVKEAGPSQPVEILGLNQVPQAGDSFTVVNDEKALKQILNRLKTEEREKRLSQLGPSTRLTADTIFKAKQNKEQEEIKDLNLILKADTDGSSQAVTALLQQLKSKEINVKLLHSGIGDISEADVMLATTCNAMIIGFRVKADANASKLCEQEDIRIKTYDIIYQISEDIEKTMLGLLSPEVKEVSLGTAEVRELFTIGKNLVIAGCYVLEGKIVRNKQAIVIRNNKEIFKGTVDNLKRFKDDAKEVLSGFECGLSFNKFNDLQEGDLIKVSTTEEIERDTLS